VGVIFSTPIQTGPPVHPASYTVDTGSFPGVKWLGCGTVAYPGIFFLGGRGSTNSVEDRRQREQGSGVGSPLVRGSAQFANG
jgi:hypothetical protein